MEVARMPHLSHRFTDADRAVEQVVSSFIEKLEVAQGRERQVIEILQYMQWMQIEGKAFQIRLRAACSPRGSKSTHQKIKRAKASLTPASSADRTPPSVTMRPTEKVTKKKVSWNLSPVQIF